MFESYPWFTKFYIISVPPAWGPFTSTPTHPEKDCMVQSTPQNGGGSARADAIGGGLDPHLRLQTSDFAMALCCDEFNSSL